MVLLVAISLFDYKIAKAVQTLILGKFVNFSYFLAIVVPWLLIGLVPFLILRDRNSLKINMKEVIANKSQLIIYPFFVILGLIVFLAFGLNKYFSSVSYPVVFFLITPIVEESIFRGWLYSFLEKIKGTNVVIVTSMLFSLHHLQYFNFSLTRFAAFQLAYTLILGLILGKVRKLSGGIHIGLAIHILINFVVVYF